MKETRGTGAEELMVVKEMKVRNLVLQDKAQEKERKERN